MLKQVLAMELRLGTQNVDSAKGAQNVEALLHAALRGREGVAGGGVGGMVGSGASVGSGDSVRRGGAWANQVLRVAAGGVAQPGFAP